MTKPSAITIDGVSKTFRVYRDRNQSLKATVLSRSRGKYREFTALDDVSLEIPEGKTFGLLGNNGSGKSTLLKCIARILEPNAGTITHRGRIAAMLEVGSGFHPELSGRENVYLNGSILGMTKAEIDRKFDAIVDFSGVEQFIDQPVKNYSSGMYVRLGFAVSIHVDPDILLVDEVLAVGDMAFQEKCMAKFAEFKREGRTVVVVSHGLEQMRSFCDEAAWLHHGVLKDVGPAAEIVDLYSNEEHGATLVEGGGKRFGTGEAQVTKLELLHPERGDVRNLSTGDRATIRLHYRAAERIERPVFGVSVDVVNGPFLWGHTSRDSGFVPDAIEPGEGTIDIEIPSVTFRPLNAYLSASIQDFDGTHNYDVWQRAFTFSVGPGTPIESGGLVTLGSKFGNLTPPRPIEAPPVRRADRED
ncbi:ABC transporter [Pseudoclavibacter endophyticus]|uniref:ABC transporter ATP-binding protein n=1 Tax=Pseudoclavibacter endophyticus TaxID=1778590 RepID=A0A6H9WJU0_9MICO|nr:ABC transporter ATP-binding protein [Pseudoclavibacter endophyticus]KAB1649116.1 ABC transporter ATP-binding protein [Pseudoclavibacter endophyticus]GGA65290.1 ABC transporter [Pseudoclavibacter endophyticus]